MIYPSTFSIVAYSPHETAWGIAVASKFPAVGAVVPWARAGAGAVATQSYANTSLGPNGLGLMESGVSAEDALRQLLDSDTEAGHRQVGFVDKTGGSATFTGASCHEWASGATGDGFAAQGNILTGPEVIDAMVEEYNRASGELTGRLYKALLAGDRAGGDRRGRQSAAILVVKEGAGYAGFNDRWIDYRVDDHADPVVRLGELLQLHELYFGSSSSNQQIPLQGEPLADLQKIMTRLGYYSGPLDGTYSAATRTALESFIGNENFEERTNFDAGLMDLPIFEYLIEHFAK